MNLIDFLIKYWLEVFLSLIVAGMGFALKKTWGLYKREREEKEKAKIKAEVNEAYQKSHKEDEIIQKEISALKIEIDIFKKGLLSIQGKIFMQECDRLLDENHDITLDEYQQLLDDHDIYNGLGGNHKGDNLFLLVEKKVSNTLFAK